MRQPLIVVDDCISLTALDLGERDVQGAPLPAKVAGEHRWLVVARYVVPIPADEIGVDTGVDTDLVPEDMLDLIVRCHDCDQAWPGENGPCRGSA